MAESFFDRHFVWLSSRDSIAAGKISLLAVAEVIFSVAAYWWIAWYFDTYAHLLISIVVAPLVLLRSDESVALGVEMFGRYSTAEDVPLRSAKGWAIVILFGVATGGAGWLAAEWFVFGYEGWPLFWRSMLVGLFALNVGFVVVATAAAKAAPTVGLAGALAGVGALVGVGALAGLGALAGVLTGAGAVAIAGAGARAGAGAGVLAVLAVALGIGLPVGVLVRAFATRLFASLRYIHRGAAAIPKNWRRTLFQIDFLCAPELVPGIGAKNPALTFGQMIKSFFPGKDIGRRTLGAIVIAIWFIPSLVYRYSIKSTCWLYLPLLYLAHLPGRFSDGKERLVWVRALPAKFYEWIRFALAVLTLGIAFFALMDAAALRNLLTEVGAGETPLNIFSLLVVLNFGDIQPWHYFTLPSAALTIILVLGLDSIRKDEAAGAEIDALGWKVTTAIFLDRVRSLLVYIWLALALYYFADDAYGRCLLPEWIMSWLEWHFGPPTCA